MLKRIRNNKSGQAIVIVMVVAVILLAIGGTVMVFASNNSNNASKQYSGKKAYYAAKSAINVIDSSLQKKDAAPANSLGTQVLNDAIGNAGSDGKTSGTLSAAVTLPSNSAVGSEYSITGTTLSYSGTVSDEGNQLHIVMDEVKVKLTGHYGEDHKYTVTSKYQYNGYVTASGSAITAYNNQTDGWTQEGTEQ